MKKPARNKNTSTPPETRLNQMWYTAAKSTATARRPSTSGRKSETLAEEAVGRTALEVSPIDMDEAAWGRTAGASAHR
ncbi:hypothetical protein GCM10028833_31930 [Glycomyces tarimensis]